MGDILLDESNKALGFVIQSSNIFNIISIRVKQRRHIHPFLSIS